MDSPRVKWRLICAEIALGSVVSLYNFRGFLDFAAAHWAPHWLANATVSLMRLSDNVLTVFTGSGAAWGPRLANWLVIGLWWYIAAVVVSSMVYMRPDRLTNGLSGLCLGLGAIVLLSWAAAVLVKFAVILAWISRFISSIGTVVFHFIASIVAAAFPYLAVIAIVLLAGCVLFKLFRKLGIDTVMSALLLLPCAGVAWLLNPVLRWCYTAVLLPIVHILGPIAAWLLGVVGVILVGIGLVLAVASLVLGLVIGLEIMGKLVIEQFRTAWDAPKGDKAMAFAGFSVGSAFAVLLMVTAGLPEVAVSIDTAWHQHAWLFNTWSPAASHFQALPDGFADALASIFKNVSAPVFDALILIALVPFGAVSMMRRAEVEEGKVWKAQDLGSNAWEIARALAGGVGPVMFAAILPRDS